MDFSFCLFLSCSSSSSSSVKYLLARWSTGLYSLNLFLMGEESQIQSCQTSYLYRLFLTGDLGRYSSVNLGDSVRLGRFSMIMLLVRALRWLPMLSITMSLQKQIERRWNYLRISQIYLFGNPKPFSRLERPSCSPIVYLLPCLQYLIPIPLRQPSLKIPSSTKSSPQNLPMPSSVLLQCSPILMILFSLRMKPYRFPLLKHSSYPNNLSSPRLTTTGWQRGISSSSPVEAAASFMKLMRNSSRVYMFLGNCWERTSKTSLSLIGCLLITSLSQLFTNWLTMTILFSTITAFPYNLSSLNIPQMVLSPAFSLPSDFTHKMLQPSNRLFCIDPNARTVSVMYMYFPCMEFLRH